MLKLLCATTYSQSISYQFSHSFLSGSPPPPPPPPPLTTTTSPLPTVISFTALIYSSHSIKYHFFSQISSSSSSFSSSHHHHTVVWKSQGSILKHWATRSSIRSFACTAHSFACSFLLALLARSSALIRLLACSFCSLPSSWETVYFKSQFHLVLNFSESPPLTLCQLWFFPLPCFTPLIPLKIIFPVKSPLPPPPLTITTTTSPLPTVVLSTALFYSSHSIKYHFSSKISSSSSSSSSTPSHHHHSPSANCDFVHCLVLLLSFH